MSLKNRIIADVATVFFNADHFAESVTLIRTVGESVLTAIVEIDEPIVQSEGPSEVEGRLSIQTSDLEQMNFQEAPVLSAIIRGENFHILGHLTDDFGVTRFSIRRNLREAKHSNLYDMSDRQAQWVNNDA